MKPFLYATPATADPVEVQAASVKISTSPSSSSYGVPANEVRALEEDSFCIENIICNHYISMKRVRNVLYSVRCLLTELMKSNMLILFP